MSSDGTKSGPGDSLEQQLVGGRHFRLDVEDVLFEPPEAHLLADLGDLVHVGPGTVTPPECLDLHGSPVEYFETHRLASLLQQRVRFHTQDGAIAVVVVVVQVALVHRQLGLVSGDAPVFRTARHPGRDVSLPREARMNEE